MRSIYFYINNPELEKISASIDSGVPRFGKIKYINDHYFMGDIETEIVLPIKIQHLEEVNTKIDA